MIDKKDILITYDIYKIEELWKKLYFSNNSLTSFQSFEWNKCLQYKKNKGIKKKCIYITYKNKLIIPLEIDNKNNNIYILGQSECSDYLDFIYCNVNKKDISVCIEYLKTYYSKYRIILDRINERSELRSILNELEYLSVEKKSCYYINIPNKENFYDTLSKNSRQNYRTANNRLINNGINIDINIINKSIDGNLNDELYKLYKKRRNNKELVKNELDLTRLMKKILKKFLDKGKQDFISAFSKSNNMFLSYLTIDNKIVAFYQGLTHRNGCIYIVRVAIDDEYKNYSPGIILLVNTIQKLQCKYNIYDLTRGDEKYKIQYGGILNYNYCFTF